MGDYPLAALIVGAVLLVLAVAAMWALAAYAGYLDRQADADERERP